MATKEEIKEKEKEVKKVENKEKDGVITAVYKTKLHCLQCARDIKRPLLRTQGVHSVDVDMEKGEIKAKGSFDPIEIQKRIEKLANKKIELISPKIQIKESVQTDKKVVKETKQAISRTTSMKVNMHCDQCARDLEKMLLRQKGIHSVKTDMKSQILTVDGTIEPEKLVSFLQRKVNKHAEIITAKKEEKKEQIMIKEEKKEQIIKEEKKEQIIKEEKKEEKGKLVVSGELGKSSDLNIIEVKEEKKIVEAAKTIEGNAPYFIHYVYAPQVFSDENPNACSIA
ncbi:hypothetical protein L484_023858 [Morus notabilis]|uniref:HMA domain-containing protein n=1 Tax=Morus notabilis TaxID=981085 RepID=W9R557_9ROSA|nr:heavy metal-associated isoprenylated plant protein 4 [Morus notabilis]EXB70672.1 hypothetical protein L484_023858 [Morus notabilis]